MHTARVICVDVPGSIVSYLNRILYNYIKKT